MSTFTMTTSSSRHKRHTPTHAHTHTYLSDYGLGGVHGLDQNAGRRLKQRGPCKYVYAHTGFTLKETESCTRKVVLPTADVQLVRMGATCI